MCEFCHRHGEGKKWYLQAQNYSEDLLSDLRRRRFIRGFISDPESFRQALRKLEGLKRLPSYVRAVVTPIAVNRQKRSHYGQVVPIEEVERIFDFVNSVTRLPCMCRQAMLGTEQRHCYALSMAPHEQSRLFGMVRAVGASHLTGPDTSGMEALSTEEALASLRDLEGKGLCHTVWTFITPFIGTICNCDRSDCVAMRATFSMDYPMMFRAEYTAEIDPDLCIGCRRCMRVCQFGAMGYSVANEKVVIDPRRCYGCGICRASCAWNAITLSESSSVPLTHSEPVLKTRRLSADQGVLI
jgi:ferredoxin